MISFVDRRGVRFSPSNEYTAVCAERIEYSTVNTTSSGISQNCPMKARFFERSGTTCGRSPLDRHRNEKGGSRERSYSTSNQINCRVIVNGSLRHTIALLSVVVRRLSNGRYSSQSLGLVPLLHTIIARITMPYRSQ